MQKPFGNLKKYIPADIASVPAVRIRYCIIGFSISFEFIGLFRWGSAPDPAFFLEKKEGRKKNYICLPLEGKVSAKPTDEV